MSRPRKATAATAAQEPQQTEQATADKQTKHPGGRPCKVSPEQLQAVIQQLIADCEADPGLIPSDYQLIQYIQQALDISVSPRTLDKWYTDNTDSYCDAIKTLVAFREHRLLHRIESDPRQATGAIFTLKQARSGGYTDRPSADTGNNEVTIKVRLDGV